MNAETRLAIVLFGSFVLWLPALGSVLRGELDAEVAGVRWALGAALVWMALKGLNHLFMGYAMDSAGDEPRRRADDAPGEPARPGPAFSGDTDQTGFGDRTDTDVTTGGT